MPDPTPTPTLTPTPTPTPEVPTSWFSSWAPEDIGYLQNKGWAKDDAATSALEAVKAYRDYERFRGVSQNEIARIPADPNDTAGYQTLYRRLGAPEKPEEYDFSGTKFEDDRLTASFHDKLRATAAELNMPKAMAERFVKAAGEAIEGYGATIAGELGQQQETLKAALQTHWGSNFDAFRVVADRGAEAIAAKMGGDFAAKVPALMEAARDAGLGEVMSEMMRVIGVGLGEDKYVNDPAGHRDAMTPQQALAEIEQLLGNGRPGSGDKEFQQRYMSGDVTARAKVSALNALIAAARESGAL